MMGRSSPFFAGALAALVFGCAAPPARTLPPPEYETPTLPPFPQERERAPSDQAAPNEPRPAAPEQEPAPREPTAPQPILPDAGASQPSLPPESAPEAPASTVTSPPSAGAFTGAP